MRLCLFTSVTFNDRLQYVQVICPAAAWTSSRLQIGQNALFFSDDLEVESSVYSWWPSLQARHLFCKSKNTRSEGTELAKRLSTVTAYLDCIDRHLTTLSHRCSVASQNKFFVRQAGMHASFTCVLFFLARPSF